MKKQPYGWDFWLSWVCACTLGFGLGLALGLAPALLCSSYIDDPEGYLFAALLEYLTGTHHLPSARFAPPFEVPLSGRLSIITGLVMGAALGLSQRNALRRTLAPVRGWVWLTALGGLWAWLVAAVPFDEIAFWTVTDRGLLCIFALSAALGGAIIGLMQWFVLRRHVSRAHWWIWANGAGWLPFTIILKFGFNVLLPRAGAWSNDLQSGGSPLAWIGIMFLLGAISGAFVGAITGVALVRLFRLRI